MTTEEKKSQSRAIPFGRVNDDGTMTVPYIAEIQDLFDSPAAYIRAIGSTLGMLLLHVTNGDMTISYEDADLMNVLFKGLSAIQENQDEFIRNQMKEVENA